MENKKSPLLGHVIRAMRRDDGYIITEATENGIQYVVYVLTTDGYKPMRTIPESDVKRLWDEDTIKYVGDGKWKLTEHVGDEKHRL